MTSNSDSPGASSDGTGTGVGDGVGVGVGVGLGVGVGVGVGLGVGVGRGPGGDTNSNAPGAVADCVSGLVTTTSTGPGPCVGVCTTTDDALTDVTVAVAPPKVTVAPETNPEPVIVTVVPPLVEPREGVTEVMDRDAR